jgi:hypothetical protein
VADPSQRNNFDVTTVAYPQSFPAKWAGGYLNTPEVQQALGVPLNWTGQSVPVGIGACLQTTAHQYFC